MATIYQKNMNIFDKTKIENIFNTLNNSFIPLDERNADYKNVLQYLLDNNLTIDQLDLFS